MEQLDTLSSQISFATDGGQYLTFRLRDEEYGVEILKVQEITRRGGSGRGRECQLRER